MPATMAAVRRGTEPRRSLAAAVLVLCSFIQCVVMVGAVDSRITAMVAQREVEVEELRGSLQEAYTTHRCAATTCPTCSVDACYTTQLTNLQCSVDFGTPPDCSAQTGQFLSMVQSSVKVGAQATRAVGEYVPGECSVDITSSECVVCLTYQVANSADAASEPVQNDVCVTSFMDPTFRGNMLMASSELQWQYLGTPSGVMRTYPGVYFQTTGNVGLLSLRGVSWSGADPLCCVACGRRCVRRL